MVIKMFNAWYFFFLALSIGAFIGLYFILRKRSEKTKKIVLFSFLVLGLLLHFFKAFIPPYSLDKSILWRDIWFINICGANIFFFPFFFLSKNERLKDYMFYFGIISGVLSILLPIEPIQKVNPQGEWLDILRFYYHHTMLWAVPLLMVMLKLHKLSYRRILFVPLYFSFILMFIVVNQFVQSELGFTAIRNEDFLDINYKNSSYIYGPGNESFAVVFDALCPKFLKTVPVGDYAGQKKYWPILWLLVPITIYLIPICFGMSMIFDHKAFVGDIKLLKIKIRERKIKKNIDNNSKQVLDNNIEEKKMNDVIVDFDVANKNVVKRKKYIKRRR